MQVYRRGPGRYRTPSPVDAVGPAAVLVVVVAALAAGSALVVKDDTRPAGAGLMLGAAVGGALGGFSAYEKSGAPQQDGATTAWHVGP